MVSLYHIPLCIVYFAQSMLISDIIMCLMFQWSIITSPLAHLVYMWTLTFNGSTFFHMGPYMSRSHQMYTCNTVCMHVCGGHIAYVSYGWVDIIACNTLLYYHFLYAWLFTINLRTHNAIPFCSVVVSLFCCCIILLLYIILYTSSNNSSSIL